jgi:hypothetical protein
MEGCNDGDQCTVCSAGICIELYEVGVTHMKPWYESKTIWVNALLLIGSVCLALLNEPAMKEYAPVIIIINTIINVILRIMTTKEVSM